MSSSPNTALAPTNLVTTRLLQTGLVPTRLFSKTRNFKRKALTACIMALTVHPAYAQEAKPSDSSANSTQNSSKNSIENDTEEVVTYGMKSSLESSQQIKRDAATVKDVITASDIGSLPDKSVLEALQRLPGVAIERFEASDDPDHFGVEGGKVVVRGLNRVRAEFNGRDALSARDSGGLSFSDIPPELVGSVEVAKNQTADLVEGGISGTINLITRKPFDSDELVLGTTVKGSYGDLAEKTNPSISGLGSNVWETDYGKVGALLSVTVSEFDSRSDSIALYNYYDNNGIANLSSEYANRNIAVPRAAHAREQKNHRDRLGLGASFQWENPNENVLLTAEFIHSRSELSWNEHYIEHTDQPFAGDPRALLLLASDDVNTEDDFIFNDEQHSFACPEQDSAAMPCLFTSGLLIGSTDTAWDSAPLPVPQQGYRAGARYRSDEREINDFSLNLAFRLNEQLTLTTDFQYVKAENDIVDTTVQGKAVADTWVDLRDSNRPRFEVVNVTTGQEANLAEGETPVSFTDASAYFLRSTMDHVSQNEAESMAFATDIDYVFDNTPLLSAFKAGVRISKREQTTRETDYNWGAVSEAWTASQVIYDQHPDLFETYTFNDHHNGNSLNINDTFWFPRMDLVRQGGANISEQYRAAGITPHEWVPLENRVNVIEGTPFLPSEIYEVEENRSAAYVRLDFGDDNSALRYSGNIGLRYVRWQLDSTGADTFPQPIFSDEDQGVNRDPNFPALNPTLDAETIAFANGEGGVRSTISGDTVSEVLPSINIKIELMDDLILRTAASRSMFMPNMRDVRRNRVIGDNVSRTIYSDAELQAINPPDGVEAPIKGITNSWTANDAGNPLLKPEMSNNYDLALEWYYADVGSLTGTLFYKDISGFHRQRSTATEITNPTSGATQTVAVTQVVNAGTAKIKGYELALQTTFGFISESLDDFGIQSSYTYIDSDAKDDITADDLTGSDEFVFRNFVGIEDVEGLSRENINFSVFYDDGTLNGRLAWSYRSDYLMHTRDVIAFSPVYAEATGQVDASFSWNINEHFSLGFEATNILDEVTKTSIQYNQEGVRTPRSYFVNDRRYGLFVKAKL